MVYNRTRRPGPQFNQFSQFRLMCKCRISSRCRLGKCTTTCTTSTSTTSRVASRAGGSPRYIDCTAAGAGVEFDRGKRLGEDREGPGQGREGLGHTTDTSHRVISSRKDGLKIVVGEHDNLLLLEHNVH